MVATLGVIQSSMAVVSAPAGSWTTRPANVLRGGIVKLPLSPKTAPCFRCQASEDSGPSGLREAVDKATKKNITKEGILRHQATELSETQSVLEPLPKSGPFYPRPELERRPETGDTSFVGVFAFDGAAPETINGRLAMLGFVWAILAEKETGLTVMEQLFTPGSTGLISFIAMVQLFSYASLVPIVNRESTDARRWGPFNAMAERWNGRLAMIGFAALIVDEIVRQAPVFQ